MCVFCTQMNLSEHFNYYATVVEYPCDTQVSARLRLRGFSFAERTRSALLGWTEVVCLCMSVCFFLNSILTEYVRMDRGCLCVCVCMCVCLCVCLCQLYSLNGWADLDEISQK